MTARHLTLSAHRLADWYPSMTGHRDASDAVFVTSEGATYLVTYRDDAAGDIGEILDVTLIEEDTADRLITAQCSRVAPRHGMESRV